MLKTILTSDLITGEMARRFVAILHHVGSDNTLFIDENGILYKLKDIYGDYDAQYRIFSHFLVEEIETPTERDKKSEILLKNSPIDFNPDHYFRRFKSVKDCFIFLRHCAREKANNWYILLKEEEPRFYLEYIEGDIEEFRKKSIFKGYTSMVDVLFTIGCLDDFPGILSRAFEYPDECFLEF
jgi:hypothetical protein